jgi:hypothetical protein
MAQLTRHTFIKKTSAGAATLGAAAAVPGLASAHTIPGAHPATAAARLQGPLVAHVRNAATGEVALLVGTREIIVHDHDLVKRLIKAAQA